MDKPVRKFNVVDIFNKRRAGVLLHITSLPGTYANGTLGQSAYKFVDFLHEAGISVWQTLPLGMTHGDGSPYQCLSAHAGNPELIDLDWVINRGWLDTTYNCQVCPGGESCQNRCTIMRAFSRFKIIADEQEKADFHQFCQDKKNWLDDFSIFLALKEEFSELSWVNWPQHFKDRDTSAVKEAFRRLHETIEVIKFEQFIFFQQWHELKAYAHQKGVLLFGDMPIFVSYDSADVWANREVFKLDENGNMTVVAGVPPDYFSETGQRWGNPHYDWGYLRETGFKWWLDRMQTQLELFDINRIDHFRGLEAAWEILATEETAINGSWQAAPGAELLNAIYTKFGDIALVAEDLGIITQEVEELRDRFKLPGMKILQFAFDGGPDNPYLPFQHVENSVVYTGTHDNDTTLGWYQNLSDQQQQQVSEYLGVTDIKMPCSLMHAAFASVANLAIVPMQDILALDGDGRMNVPGTVEGNWQWRFNWQQLTADRVNKLTRMVDMFGRR